MTIADLVIENVNLYSEGGIIHSGVAVKDGKIVVIAADRYLPPARNVIDGKGQHLLPGGIDPHVHFRDPGKTERETFQTGTMAAAAGGVTTICEHPISMPPPYSPELLKRRIAVASQQSVVDFAFFGAAGADKLEEIPRISREEMIAFKTFFHKPPEGREEEFAGLTMANDAKIYEGFCAIAKTGKILAIHAENDDIIAEQIKKLRKAGKVTGIHHAESRPPISEVEAVAKVLCIAAETGTRVQLCHISTGAAAELVKKAKQRGQEVYLETCPHYLLANESALEKLGPFAKCNPPLRKQEIVDDLWRYVQDGTVDLIGSDHGPFLPSEKEIGYQDIFTAPAGFPGIDLRLPLLLNAMKSGKITLKRIIELICTNPAKTYGLYPQKGAIRIGADADFVMVDLERAFVVDRQKGYSRSADTARLYDGLLLYGLPTMTIVRGRVVMRNGIVAAEDAGWGQLVTVSK